MVKYVNREQILVTGKDEKAAAGKELCLNKFNKKQFIWNRKP
jgi:hypothetical protein